MRSKLSSQGRTTSSRLAFSAASERQHRVDRAARIHDRAEGGVGELEVEREHAREVVRSGNVHDGAAAGAGLDPECALELEEAERLPHGGARHAELLDHPVLGGELRAGSQAPAPDLADELPGDADGGALGLSLSAHPLDVSPRLVAVG